MTVSVATDLFALAVTLETIRCRADVQVSIAGPEGASVDLEDAEPGWPAFLRAVTEEILSQGGESTTETADIALVKSTSAYHRFVQQRPDLVRAVSAVITTRDSVIEEVFDE
ncbi:hypothetical protein RQ831_19295 [Roseomonas gilardii]|uniref:Uncharacterized protein n=1 Tax=Roseomonas gilardii TaxID=257708 RepID=A0ABU3MJX7_9PROT|nr:hypothetical protein [Roseomonas gilardii]MDT8333202.1 hypothetical protein [Roseomonas gilardii]